MNKFVFALCTSLVSLFSCGTGNQQIDGGNGGANPLMSFHYGKYGTMAQPECDFTVEKVDEKECRVVYFNHDRGYSDLKQRDTVSAPVSLLSDIAKIVSEHKMHKYKERYKSMFEVLDGDSWDMQIKYEDGKRVSSGGYAAGPKDDGLRVILDMMRERFEGL